MAEEAQARRRPLLNPVLRFTRDPKPESVVGGGKSSTNIKHERLEQQRRRLAESFAQMARDCSDQAQFGGRAIVYAQMFADSLAATWTPNDFLHPERGARLITPYRQGYLAEVDVRTLEWFSHFAIAASTARDRVDISRIESVRFHEREDVVRGRDLDALWEAAPKYGEGRSFLIWFMPVSDGRAAEDVLKVFERLREAQIETPPPLLDGVELETGLTDPFRRELLAIGDGDRLNGALRQYRRERQASTVIVVRSRDAFDALLASGTVVRLEPVLPLLGTSPGEGAEPARPLPGVLADLPIVGIVDGGMTAPSYKPAEVWRADPPLVTNAAAEVKHGNRITSLIVQGHDWNNNLKLPPLYCRFGTVQAIAKPGHHGADPESFVAYLDAVVATHPETRVWNLSLNQPVNCTADSVSYLGHALADLARRHGVLLVNSIGNTLGKENEWLQPPADCEAALTVGGRQHNDEGLPSGLCAVSLAGPGPASLLKPDTAHFSKVRALGGSIEEGSSFAAALTAPLAAHTMHRLREPTPDLAKALIIHQAGDGIFSANTGWGNPSTETLPWECRPGAVTFHWQAELRPGAAYYWEVPIPEGLLDRGRLRGSGKLTAVLNPHPLVSDIAGPNYFSARLATAIQFPRKDKFHNLLGSMERETTAEEQARTLDHKWCPIRHHSRDFSTRGISIDDNHLRVYARIYTRDLYLYGFRHMDEVEALTATFVLTLEGIDEDGDLYGQFREALGPYVETSVIETDIDIDFTP